MPPAETLDLDAIRAAATAARERSRAATPGPWLAADDSSDTNDPCWSVDAGDAAGGCVAPFQTKANAEFIAAARSDVPTLATGALVLADELTRLRAAVVAHLAAESALDEVTSVCREFFDGTPQQWRARRDAANERASAARTTLAGLVGP